MTDGGSDAMAFPRTPEDALYAGLKEKRLDFFVSVPCKLLAKLISLIETDPGIIYTPVSREEEGIGIMAGAFLAGKRPAILMQNSGLGNCINAICSHSPQIQRIQSNPAGLRSAAG